MMASLLNSSSMEDVLEIDAMEFSSPEVTTPMHRSPPGDDTNDEDGAPTEQDEVIPATTSSSNNDHPQQIVWSVRLCIYKTASLLVKSY